MSDKKVSISEAFKNAQSESDLTTSRDIDGLRNEMNVRFERIDGELKFNRWMLGALLAGVISLVLKAYF